MKLEEAKKYLNENGYILIEDTDEWDEADMPAGMSDEDRAALATQHNERRGVQGGYYGKKWFRMKNYFIAKEFSEKYFPNTPWYKERFHISGVEKLDDDTYKITIDIQNGVWEREDYVMEITCDTHYNFIKGHIEYYNPYSYKKEDEMDFDEFKDYNKMLAKHNYSR